MGRDDDRPASTGTRRLTDLDATDRFGAALASTLEPGDVVLLVGDLGAGKTTLVRSLAAQLGVRDPVVSPTFTIMRHLPFTGPSGRPGLLLHLDAYRLTGAPDLDDLGLFELLDDGAIAVIEWGDVVRDAFDESSGVVVVELLPGDDPSERIARWSGVRQPPHADRSSPS